MGSQIVQGVPSSDKPGGVGAALIGKEGPTIGKRGAAAGGEGKRKKPRGVCSTVYNGGGAGDAPGVEGEGGTGNGEWRGRVGNEPGGGKAKGRPRVAGDVDVWPDKDASRYFSV